MAGKYLGNDGIYYDSYKEMYNKNREMKQRDEHNKLLKEQNKLIDTQIKMQKNQNQKSPSFDVSGLADHMTNEEIHDFVMEGERAEIFVYILLAIPMYFACTKGLIDAIISIPFYMMNINVYDLNENHNFFGMILFSLFSIRLIWVVIRYNKNKNNVKQYHKNNK